MPLARRIKPVRIDDPFYHQMWRIVDGAVRKTFQDHPEYLSNPGREKTVRQSISKRVVGALSGFVGQERLILRARRGTDPVE